MIPNILLIVTWAFLLLLVFHFIGYPAIIYLCYQFASKGIRKSMITPTVSLPTVSLLIAAYNEEEIIGQKIESCLNLDYPADKIEFIVISDGSTDKTASIAKSFSDSRLKCLESDERGGKSQSLNKAAQQAFGEILIVSDANAILDPVSIRELASNFADPTVGCVTGSRKLLTESGTVEKSAGFYWRYESAIKKWESHTGSSMGVLGSLLAVRSSIFKPIPQHLINDDFYLALLVLNAGQRIIYEPKAICGAYASTSLEQEKVRRKRISAGRFQHFLNIDSWRTIKPFDQLKLFSHKYLRLLLFPILMGALLFNGLYIWFRPSDLLMVVILVLQLSFYLLALSSLFMQARLPAIASYIVVGAFAAMEGIAGYLVGSQTVLWNKATRTATTSSSTR